MAERQVFHSTHKDDSWRVLLGGEVLATFDTQKDAQEDAVSRAKAVHDKGGVAQVIFHNKIGGILEEYTYGKDPERHQG